MVFPPQQAATDLEQKETDTSHIQILFPSLLKISMKDSVACKATTGVQCLFAGRAGP